MYKTTDEMIKALSEFPAGTRIEDIVTNGPEITDLAFLNIGGKLHISIEVAPEEANENWLENTLTEYERMEGIW